MVFSGLCLSRGLCDIHGPRPGNNQCIDSDINHAKRIALANPVIELSCNSVDCSDQPLQ